MIANRQLAYIETVNITEQKLVRQPFTKYYHAYFIDQYMKDGRNNWGLHMSCWNWYSPKARILPLFILPPNFKITVIMLAPPRRGKVRETYKTNGNSSLKANPTWYHKARKLCYYMKSSDIWEQAKKNDSTIRPTIVFTDEKFQKQPAVVPRHWLSFIITLSTTVPIRSLSVKRFEDYNPEVVFLWTEGWVFIQIGMHFYNTTRPLELCSRLFRYKVLLSGYQRFRRWAQTWYNSQWRRKQSDELEIQTMGLW